MKPRVWQQWGWSDAGHFGAPMKEALVLGKDIRAGDKVLFVIKDGQRVDSFSDRAIVKKTKDGRLGFENIFVKGDNVSVYNFAPNEYYEVQLPRPEPEMNEFGPVSP